MINSNIFKDSRSLEDKVFFFPLGYGGRRAAAEDKAKVDEDCFLKLIKKPVFPLNSQAAFSSSHVGCLRP